MGRSEGKDLSEIRKVKTETLETKKYIVREKLDENNKEHLVNEQNKGHKVGNEQAEKQDCDQDVENLEPKEFVVNVETIEDYTDLNLREFLNDYDRFI